MGYVIVSGLTAEALARSGVQGYSGDVAYPV